MSLLRLKCPNCGSRNVHRISIQDDRYGVEDVKCDDCGWVTGWFEAFMAGTTDDRE